LGYRGKVKEQERARALRAQNRTLADIAETLGVSKSSVSIWVRDVPFTPTLKLRGPHRRPHPAHEAKLRQIEELDREGAARIGTLSDAQFLVAGVALYAGEGSKGDGAVQLANADATIIRFFCAWLRHFFAVDESRLRVRVYLHQGLDLEAAEAFWSATTGVRGPSSVRRIGRCPTRAFGTTSTCMAARTRTTAVPRRTVGSWD
jgi:hypothetical protein